MNRIESLRRSPLLQSFAGSDAASSLNQQNKRDGSELDRIPVSLSFAHRIFVPEHYEPRYEYPLVIWLHSDQSSEGEIDSIMPVLSLRNYVACGLRGTGRAKGKKRLYDWSLTPHGIALTEECIFEAIEQMTQSLSIHPERIFLAGMGRGGTVAQYIGLRHPDRFGGVVSINGPFPTMPRSLARWKEAKNLPILWMHGNQSEHCGMDAMCRMLQAAYPAALQVFPVQFASGEELDAQMLNKMNRFLMQIVTGESICMHEPMHAD